MQLHSSGAASLVGMYLLPVVLLSALVMLWSYPHSPVLHLAQVVNLLLMGLGILLHIEFAESRMVVTRREDACRRRSIDLYVILTLLTVIIKVVLK